MSKHLAVGALSRHRTAKAPNLRFKEYGTTAGHGPP